MANAYERAIYDELGYEIAQQLKDTDCKFVVKIETLQFTFTNCPVPILNKILEVKKIKGERSILNEFVPFELLI